MEWCCEKVLLTWSCRLAWLKGPFQTTHACCCPLEMKVTKEKFAVCVPNQFPAYHWGGRGDQGTPGHSLAHLQTSLALAQRSWKLWTCPKSAQIMYIRVFAHRQTSKCTCIHTLRAFSMSNIEEWQLTLLTLYSISAAATYTWWPHLLSSRANLNMFLAALIPPVLRQNFIYCTYTWIKAQVHMYMTNSSCQPYIHVQHNVICMYIHPRPV